MSNFRPVKRVLDIVRVFERVQRELPAVLLMVGDGPERASAQALARRLGIAERVRFPGPPGQHRGDHGGRRSLSAALRARKLRPLRTRGDGLRRARHRQRRGRPAEVVEQGVTGYLLPVGDIDGMATRALELFRDEARRRTMARPPAGARLSSSMPKTS